MYHVRNGVKVPLAHNIWQPCKHSINQVRFDRRNESILRREVEVGEGDELAFGPPPLGPNRSWGRRCTGQRGRRTTSSPTEPSTVASAARGYPIAVVRSPPSAGASGWLASSAWPASTPE